MVPVWHVQMQAQRQLALFSSGDDHRIAVSAREALQYSLGHNVCRNETQRYSPVGNGRL
ncbi:hypothetical protein BDA96_01G136200 [Sorghum bicolor]|uniref:Uncharacterized protein n=1 Tax=Sorghum bicolor TaxID=4558 RepID=A0A921UY26_SORBI|nr:hypothetical protein BDA96_01G136200 [Sorghum bicolor]